MMISSAIGIMPKIPIFRGRTASAPRPVSVRQGISINDTLPKTAAMKEVLLEASVVNDITCDTRNTIAVTALTESVLLLISAF